MNAMQRLIEMGADNSDARQIVAYLEVLPSMAHREDFLLGCVAILIQSNADLRACITNECALLTPEQMAEAKEQMSGMTELLAGSGPRTICATDEMVGK